ncbi:hypothetical protein SAMN06265379_11053 [Saccharicrinis carchari]|uniref:Short-chain dehydrogenase n=1 Tax=Saccharicrinis carchari TaxID=1168039 RepID=A0A521EPH8_SACCC|nr:SDR family oxidoreductase [Saccharicrinis carchari]SMO85802.1 hypothetical protein SAMN06265379_11053 [Saccharicrinis carchari]
MINTNRTALITGASSGIGTVYAKTLAKEGWGLIVVGRRNERLTKLKQEIQLHHKVNIQILVADLSVNEDLEHLLSVIDHSPGIELLINNAGFGSSGDYFKSKYSIQQQMLDVHITACTRIVHHAVPKMIKRGKGAIINVASLSAFFPAPNSYFYCSTKAFMVTFSECMHIDLKSHNIKVQALCPGFTHTEFHSRQGIVHSGNYLQLKLLWKSPQQVVNKSLKALRKSKVICIPGLLNRIIYLFSKVIPNSIYYKLAAHNSDMFLHSKK